MYKFMADKSFVKLPKSITQHIHTNSYISSTGFSKSSINKPNHQMGFSVTHQDSRNIKKLVVRKEQVMKQVVGQKNDSLKVEVIDDTALVEMAGGFKKCRGKKGTDVGFGDGKKKNKKRDNGFKKPSVECSMKCVNEKKGSEGRVAEEWKRVIVKKVEKGKDRKEVKKMGDKVKAVYRRKDDKNVKMEGNGVEGNRVLVYNLSVSGKIGRGLLKESKADLNLPEKITVKAYFPKNAVNLKVSNGKENDLNVKNICGKVKAVYRRKDTKNLEMVGNGVEEHQKVDNLSVSEKSGDGLLKESEIDLNETIVGEAFVQENEVNVKVSNGNEKELVENETVDEKDDGLKLNPKIDVCIVKNEVEDRILCEKSGGGLLKESEVDLNEAIVGEAFVQESEVNLKVSNGIEKELVEIGTVNEKDDGLKLNPEIDVCIVKNEVEDRILCENATVGSKKADLQTEKNETVVENVSGNMTVVLKKIAYSREELEALRFVDGEGQKKKWNEVFLGFAPTVAMDYNSLVVDVNTRQPQRCNHVANYGSTCHSNAILGMPPVLPLSSSSYDRRFPPYDRVGLRAYFY